MQLTYEVGVFSFFWLNEFNWYLFYYFSGKLLPPTTTYVCVCPHSCVKSPVIWQWRWWALVTRALPSAPSLARTLSRCWIGGLALGSLRALMSRMGLACLTLLRPLVEELLFQDTVRVGSWHWVGFYKIVKSKLSKYKWNFPGAQRMSKWEKGATNGWDDKWSSEMPK